MKHITIKVEKGEIIDGNNPSSEPISIARKISSADGIESVFFAVSCTLYQPKTNSRLRQTKSFQDFNSAKAYLEKFVKANPLSDAILYKESQKLLLIFD